MIGQKISFVQIHDTPERREKQYRYNERISNNEVNTVKKKRDSTKGNTDRNDLNLSTYISETTNISLSIFDTILGYLEKKTGRGCSIQIRRKLYDDEKKKTSRNTRVHQGKQPHPKR